MGWMTITHIPETSEEAVDKYRVEWSVDHGIGEAVVDGSTARLLELAKKAGAAERAAEIRKLLELSW